MADRRMFSVKVVQSGRFLMLSDKARLLYYDLGMAADDAGAVEAFKILKMTGATERELNELVEKGFIVILDSDNLAVYMVDFNINNTLRGDRIKQSRYQSEIANYLESTIDKGCNQLSTKCQPNDNQMTTKCQPNVSIREEKRREVKLREVKRREVKCDEEIAAQYFEDEISRNALIKFIKYRKDRKKPMTDEAIRLTVIKLQKYSSCPEDVEAIINESIANGWTGVFELKTNKRNGGDFLANA